jgi:hypothetical protein
VIRLLDLAADAVVYAAEQLVVASASLHDRAVRSRASYLQTRDWLFPQIGDVLGDVRHCPACLVVAPRGAPCACPQTPSAPGSVSASSPYVVEPGAGREVDPAFCVACGHVLFGLPSCLNCGRDRMRAVTGEG